MNEVIESVASVNRTYFDGIESEEVRPFGGFATCQVFELNSDASQRLQLAYEETMPELYFGRDPLPSWKDICGRVTEKRNLL
ncbi:MAG TPA: hypothetical protein VMU68_14460 [Acidimicrobiales bacterium]|nr:hypothetical protein [Acidimicrobiales bacterium]